MNFPLLQKEKSIDDFVDAEQSCRLSALLADDAEDGQEEKLYVAEVQRMVRDAMGGLDERELHIIRNRFGLLGGHELTLEEIGRTLGLSRERVRQLEREAKEKLRTSLGRFQPHFKFSLA